MSCILRHEIVLIYKWHKFGKCNIYCSNFVLFHTYTSVVFVNIGLTNSHYDMQFGVDILYPRVHNFELLDLLSSKSDSL